ncbi:PREDICTED: disease resistance protein RPH8A-like [Erythranthe guttata]|uniref:disease resistance protein RPH8A-like n=1 Tax=Erythranthe guttata TaxID=4155 RepID=UPI00064D7878|nr:PREDICTED: disease resistance protein RPH8A-like [Erythranthe guttata]|eukprot:XP_012843074.1 PREDICTED: disease resistance protein RPH8A-like [Erythranthe guttata]
MEIVEEEITSFHTATDKICSIRYSNFTSSYYNTDNQQQNLLVGLDDQITALKKWIFDPNSHVLVKSVVGMTGIGKTSLVKQVYNDPLVIKEFEARLFLHIGPGYTRWKDIMLRVLDELGVVISSDKLDDKNYLENQFWEALSTQKYLIVLDDVWADDYHLIMPGNRKGSQIIIISQIQRFYDYIYTQKFIILPFLNDDNSWKLLHHTAFSNREEKCSRELEKIGKKIAKNCEGLPAAIIQVGENLRGKSFEEWKTLSEKEDPLVITRYDDTPLSKALFFSYMMLPLHLKPFFLYMGVFPKHYAISRSKLIKLWVSEGFLGTDPGIEEIAGNALDLLILQSVVLREKHASVTSYKFKNCRLHFTFRSLCVSEAKSEKFFHILKKYTDCTPENIRRQQRLCVHNNVVFAFTQVHEWMESVPNVRSLLCFGPKQQYPVLLPLCFRLLKVLDALAIRFYEFPHQLLALVHLMYLSITCDRELPNSISTLWNLEVLIFTRHHNIKLSNNDPIYLPIDIWNMHKLKQLYCKGFDLPPPPDDCHLESLLTISGVSVHSCTVEVLSRIPKLTRIAVQIESAHDSTETFSFFGHLASVYDEFVSFKCVVVNPNLSSQIVRSVPNFPMSIRKISLSGCGFPWENMEVIASLPNLIVLKLRWYAFCGPLWKTSQGQFPSLEFLLLEDLDIENLEFDIQSLRWVIVRHCYKLESISNQFKYTKLLEIDDCSPSFMKKMREWQSFSGAEAKISSSITDL